MPIKHTTVKVPGQRVFAVADWNAEHEITSPLPVGTLTLASGSITDSSGAISFANENLSTSGTIASSGGFDTAGTAVYSAGGLAGVTGTFYVAPSIGGVISSSVDVADGIIYNITVK